MKRFAIVFSGVLVLLLLACLLDAEAQCAMCRATVEKGNAEGTSKIGAGLNTGILYLMAIPYVVAGTIGFFWYRQHKLSKKQQNG